MRITFCGVRGSTPAPGQDFVRYGGHTSCVAIAGPDRTQPHLVLDAGTGLQRLTRQMAGAPFRGTILLGHLHWDHTHGLPFFAAGDQPTSSVHVLLPGQEQDAEAVLRGVMSPPHFPITPAELRGDWRFGGLEPGVHALEDFDVLALDVPHKGGRTFGYRITDAAGASVAYLSDHSPTTIGPGEDGLGALHEAARRLVDGVDVLIHDAQYTLAEFPARRHFGHCSVDYAVALAETCGAGRLVLFHHDPSRTDDALDAIVAGLAGAAVPVTAAAEGAVLEVPGHFGL